LAGRPYTYFLGKGARGWQAVYLLLGQGGAWLAGRIPTSWAKAYYKVEYKYFFKKELLRILITYKKEYLVIR
jgi:hypothetical protein